MNLANHSDLSPLSTPSEKFHRDALQHEAVVYINRLGQFMYFAKALGLDTLCPKVKDLMLFRNKHTAHRSIDTPRNETFEVQELQAMAFNFYELTNASFPIFRIQHNELAVDFHMRDDHVIVGNEAMLLLQSFICVS